MLMLVGYDGQLQRDEPWLLERIVIPESNYVFQRQQPLRFSIRYRTTGLGSYLTWYSHLAYVGAPIVIKDRFKVNELVSLFLL